MAASPTPYEVVGTVGPIDTNHYWVLDVQTNDTVLISVSPDSGGAYYVSTVFFPNLTEIENSGYSSGTHSHEFIAEEIGNYLLRIHTVRYAFNYTVKSSHEIPDGGLLQATPYSTIESIQTYDTRYHDILGVKKGEAVLISVAIDRPDTYYNSVVLFPNLTQVESTFQAGTHAYEFVAAETGNYLLKIWNGGYAFNYTVKCSHTMTPQPSVPDFTLTSFSDTLTVEIGSIVNATITVQSYLGYASDVSLNVSNVPSDVIVVFNPALVALPSDGQANSTLTLYAGLSAEVKTTILYVTGKGWDQNRSCRINLTVQEVIEKLPSSASCDLNASTITYTEKVLISASIEPPMSTGTIRIQSTKDETTWDDLVLYVPSEGQCSFVWTPNAGTYLVRARWSGDYNHLPCVSNTKKLIVDKKSTTLTIALSTNIADLGQYLTANASISPPLPLQNAVIQYSTANVSWQNLASGLTDQTGSFTHIWLPQGNRVFWIRSTWNGSDNYNGDSSKATVLIIESGHPTILTRIEIDNTTLQTEYHEDSTVQYVVVDGNSNVVKHDAEMLNTSSIGVFELWITYLGNETYKSCFFSTNYTVSSIACKIENVGITSEYTPNLIELLLEYIYGNSGENKTYSGCAAYVSFEVRKTLSGDLIHQYSNRLDTSAIGYNIIDLVFEGNETHKAASVQSFRYKVLERVPIGTVIQLTMAILIPLSTLLIGVRTGLWRRLWEKWKKSREKKKIASESSSKPSENQEETQKPEGEE